MFITNFAIVFRFMRAKCNGSNSSQSTNQTLAKSATRGTAMVVTVSITFLLLTAPTAVNMALWQNIRLSNNTIYRAFMNLTQYLNHSINGVLYIIIGSRFRNELLKLFCKKRKIRMPCVFRIQLTTQVSLASVKVEADINFFLS